MLSPKRFLTKARNGQMSDFTRQRKISGNGHFMVYTADEKRYEANGRIILPYNAVFLENILSLIRRNNPSEDKEEASADYFNSQRLVLKITLTAIRALP
ncbi:hypothetical protein H6P81_019062 [Aristolochia fimbriata]|uniref:Uncharacterized protein n=1 Tax=Aristolochia fimbriata TaxID=158543 RepID=A0AAV7E7F4_ARIFI|nr:hypothetical protein H6P81_019062 [Aristolochia fimbriata]